MVNDFEFGQRSLVKLSHWHYFIDPNSRPELISCPSNLKTMITGILMIMFLLGVLDTLKTHRDRITSMKERLSRFRSNHFDNG
ncbi:hypothetical protein Q8W40_20080 [Vibrio penaeicida]|uniref:hypothetical protein n=1 Tax=Vibrio penaeicida TaxID=104609 RepID=UPI0027331805|nr:hypothetical protein [Vibrio penaeicida]MDP2574502.1 hypothetical protein [Vibrio penaeicida]